MFIFFRELVGHERPRPSVLLALGASSWEVNAGLAFSKWMLSDLLDLSRPKEIIEKERK